MLNSFKYLLAIALALVAAACPLRIAVGATPAITDRSELLIVYERAVDAGRFDAAFRHALAGCEQLAVIYLCREVADLPLQMAGQGVSVPAWVGAEQRRVATLACLTGKPMVNSDRLNFTGFICGYYAQHFALAHSPERKRAFLTRALHYLDAIHDIALARSLYHAACRHDNAASCDHFAALSRATAAGQR